MSEEIVSLKYKDKTIKVPKQKIREFADYLSTLPAFSPNNVDTHIRFMYTGNQLAVYEFMQWYGNNK